MTKKEQVAIVIPAYNEERTLAATLQDVRKNFPQAQLFVVDDGSHDKTAEIARKYPVTLLRHVINRGLGAALATGIQDALMHGAEYIVTFDADLQHVGEDVNRLLEPLRVGSADVVIGSRFMTKKDLQQMPFVKKLGNNLLTGVTNVLSGTSITDSQSGLRAFSRAAAEELMILGDRYEVSSEIIQVLGTQQFRIQEIPIKAIYDDYSKTKGTTVSSGIHILWGVLARRFGFKK